MHFKVIRKRTNLSPGDRLNRLLPREGEALKNTGNESVGVNLEAEGGAANPAVEKSTIPDRETSGETFSSKKKIPPKFLRRRSLSPWARVQAMVEEKETEK